MTSAAEHLHVGAAGRGGADPEEDLAWPRPRDLHLAQLDPLRAEEVDGSLRAREAHGRASGWRSTFSALRALERSTASSKRESGSRWVTRGEGSRRPLSMSR